MIMIDGMDAILCHGMVWSGDIDDQVWSMYIDGMVWYVVDDVVWCARM